MYDSHFGFAEKPFRLKADQRFFYPTMALQRIEDAIEAALAKHSSLIVLTGAAGSGKTTLLQQCQQRLGVTRRVLPFNNTTLPLASLLDQLGESFELTLDELPVVEKIQQLQQVLQQQADNPPILMIDDAHNLSPDTLRSLIQLSKLPTDERVLFICLLSGLDKLHANLAGQEADLHCHMEGFDQRQIADYIQHQLLAAGYQQQNLFTPNSIELITEYTQGNPRTINSLCDAALFIAAMEGQQFITPEIIDKAAEQCFLKEPERVSYEYIEPPQPVSAQSPLVGSQNVQQVYDNESEADNRQFSAAETMVVAGLGESSDRDVLGLRVGDVSAELAAAGIVSPKLADDLQTPVNLEQIDSVEALDRPLNEELVQTTQEIEPVAMPDIDKATIEQQAVPPGRDFTTSLSDQQQSRAAHVPVPPSAAGKRVVYSGKKSFSWLGLLGKLVVFLLLLGLIVGFKPDLFNLTHDDLKSYLRGARERVMQLLGQQQNNQTTGAVTIPAPSQLSEPVKSALVESTNSTASASVAPPNESTAAVAESTTAEAATTGQQAEKTATVVMPVTAAEFTSKQTEQAATVESDTEQQPVAPAAAPLVSDMPVIETVVEAESEVNDTATAIVQPDNEPAIVSSEENAAADQQSQEQEQEQAEPTAYTDTVLNQSVQTPAEQNSTDIEQASQQPAPAEPTAEDDLAVLLARAEEQMRAQRLTTPESDNAFATYQQILQRDADNETALAGLETIKDTYKRWADNAYRSGDNEKARAFLQRALKVDPQDRDLIGALDLLSSQQ